MSLASGGTLQEPKISRIEVELQGETGERCIVGLRRGRNRNIAVSIEGRALGEQMMDLAHPFTVYAPGLAGVPKEERFLSPGVVRRIVARGDANLVLRNVLHMLSSDTKAWNVFLDDMRSLFPEIDLWVEFNENSDENIGAYFQVLNGPKLPVDAAGTSILQASQILAYVGLFRPRVLILDEPDSHLHPDNQRALCNLIFRIAKERDFQALISTHSRHVLDATKDRGEVVWLSRGSIVDEPDVSTTAMLLELGALDSVDYFANDALKCVVATEDTDKEPLQALLWSNGFVERDTEVASYAGCSKMEAALVLGRFLRDKAKHLELVIHRDRDYMAPDRASKFEQGLAYPGIAAFLTEGNDIETYFLNPSHIHYLNPAVPVERLAVLIEEASKLAEQDSVAAIVNLRTEQAFQIRRETGDVPDHGTIAVTAHSDYRSDPATFRRGKKVLGRLISLVQQEMKTNPRIFHPSPFLHSAKLKQLSEKIWGQQKQLTLEEEIPF